MSTRAVDKRQPAHAGWRVAGQALVREISFRDFDEAIGFVGRVARAAEDYLRRPDMCILDFNRVRLRIASPNHAGITQAELRLAEKVNSVIGGA